jgi:hypothetical protein
MLVKGFIIVVSIFFILTIGIAANIISMAASKIYNITT